MSRRRKSREIAIKVLYQVDLVGAEVGEALRSTMAEEHVRPMAESVAREIVRRLTTEAEPGERFATDCAERAVVSWPGAPAAADLRADAQGLGEALAPQLPVEDLLTALAQKSEAIARIGEFAGQLVQTTLAHQAEIDAVLDRVAANWSVERMAVLDRCILRLGAGELLYFPDIPGSVSINEAIDLAKKYSTARSSEFVNGVLDRIQREMKPEKSAPASRGKAAPGSSDRPAAPGTASIGEPAPGGASAQAGAPPAGTGEASDLRAEGQREAPVSREATGPSEPPDRGQPPSRSP